MGDIRFYNNAILFDKGAIAMHADCCCEDCETPCAQCPDGCGPYIYHAIVYLDGDIESEADLYWQSDCCWRGSWIGGGAEDMAMLIYDSGWKFYVVSGGGYITCDDLDDGYSCPLIEFDCINGGSFNHPEGWLEWLFEVTPVV
jgi:hypothetical protein